MRMSTFVENEAPVLFKEEKPSMQKSRKLQLHCLDLFLEDGQDCSDKVHKSGERVYQLWRQGRTVLYSQDCAKLQSDTGSCLVMNHRCGYGFQKCRRKESMTDRR